MRPTPAWSVDGALWAPVLTIRWTRQDTGEAQVLEIPNIPPELFGTADQARAKALWHGKNWVDRRGG